MERGLSYAIDVKNDWLGSAANQTSAAIKIIKRQQLKRARLAYFLQP
jgi:hypothetical protein